MKHIVSSGNFAILNPDKSSKYLFCPFSQPQSNCGTWCPLFEVSSVTDNGTATTERAILHCSPGKREVELTEQFTKKG